MQARVSVAGLLLVASVIVTWAQAARGQEGALDLAAEELQVDLQAQVVQAVGDVHLVLPALELTSDWLEVDLQSGELRAGQARLLVDLARGPVRAGASTLWTHDDAIVLQGGWLTICSCEPPLWSLGFASLQLTDEGDVEIRKGWIRLGRVLTLPVPWMLLRTGRKPGLLPPQLGWLAGRGAHLSMGAAIPAPGGLDLELRLGWIAPDGMSIQGSVGAAGRRLQTMLVLDPVNHGLDAGWIQGGLHGGSGGQDVGLVVDLPVTDGMQRADMPGPDGGAARLAMSLLSMHLRPSLSSLSMLVELGLTRRLVSAQHGAKLLATESWVRAPSVALSLGPYPLGGRRVPVTLLTQLTHLQLFGVQGGTGPDHVHLTGLDVVFAGRFLPGGFLDVRAMTAWHGALMHASGEEQSSLLTQLFTAGGSASVALLSPIHEHGWSHRIDLDLRYRGAWYARIGNAGALPDLWPLRPPPSHLVALDLINTVLHQGWQRFRLDLSGYLVARGHDQPTPHLGIGAQLDIAHAVLEMEAVLAADRWGPGSVLTRLILPAARVRLNVAHLWISGNALTAMELEANESPMLAAPLVADLRGTLHLVLVGIRLQAGEGMVIEADGAMDLSSGKVSWVRASLDLAHPCGCLKVGLMAMKRAGVQIPDLLVTLSI